MKLMNDDGLMQTKCVWMPKCERCQSLSAGAEQRALTRRDTSLRSIDAENGHPSALLYLSRGSTGPYGLIVYAFFRFLQLLLGLNNI